MYVWIKILYQAHHITECIAMVCDSPLLSRYTLLSRRLKSRCNSNVDIFRCIRATSHKPPFNSSFSRVTLTWNCTEQRHGQFTAEVDDMSRTQKYREIRQVHIDVPQPISSIQWTLGPSLLPENVSIVLKFHSRECHPKIFLSNFLIRFFCANCWRRFKIPVIFNIKKSFLNGSFFIMLRFHIRTEATWLDLTLAPTFVTSVLWTCLECHKNRSFDFLWVD